MEILENGKPSFHGEEVRGRETAPLVIDTRGLSKSYKGVEALKPLDLKVSKHSIFGFLGPNGSGKSTTIKSSSATGAATSCYSPTGPSEPERRRATDAPRPRYTGEGRKDLLLGRRPGRGG